MSGEGRSEGVFRYQSGARRSFFRMSSYSPRHTISPSPTSPSASPTGETTETALSSTMSKISLTPKPEQSPPIAADESLGTPMRGSFGELPPEISARILAELSIGDLPRIARVSRGLTEPAIKLLYRHVRVSDVSLNIDEQPDLPLAAETLFATTSGDAQLRQLTMLESVRSLLVDQHFGKKGGCVVFDGGCDCKGEPLRLPFLQSLELSSMGRFFTEPRCPVMTEIQPEVARILPCELDYFEGRFFGSEVDATSEHAKMPTSVKRLMFLLYWSPIDGRLDECSVQDVVTLPGSFEEIALWIGDTRFLEIHEDDKAAKATSAERAISAIARLCTAKADNIILIDSRPQASEDTNTAESKARDEGKPIEDNSFGDRLKAQILEIIGERSASTEEQKTAEPRIEMMSLAAFAAERSRLYYMNDDDVSRWANRADDLWQRPTSPVRHHSDDNDDFENELYSYSSDEDRHTGFRRYGSYSGGYSQYEDDGFDSDYDRRALD